jgi:hypothetical protein
VLGENPPIEIRILAEEDGTKMRPEARDRFLANAEATAKSLGGESFQDGIDLARRTLAMLIGLFDAIRTPELLANALDEWDPGPELESLIVQCMADAPLLLRWILMQLNQSAQASLPTVPNRRPAVSGKTQVEIVRFVNELNFQHDVMLEDAKRRAAKRFGCSVRTVERYWRERKKILENGPKLHFNDLLKELFTAIQFDLQHDPSVTAKDVEAGLSALGLNARSGSIL